MLANRVSAVYAYAASRVLSSARLRRPTRARIQAGAIFWNRKCIELAPDCRIERGAIVDARQGAQGAISIGPESRIASGAIVVSFTERILIGRKTNINYHSVVQGETTIGVTA